MRVLFAGGGTGGHLYPGIAVAEELVRRDASTVVSFVGTSMGLEARAVPSAGFEVDFIRSAGLKGKSAGALVRGLGLLPLSALDAWRVLSRRRPDVVVGVGGYSSGPVLALAALAGTPTLLMEQNAVPGFTNRRLAPFVRAAAVSFESTLAAFPGRAFLAGNPVRRGFLEQSGVSDPSPGGDLHVLILGGSQGARAINDAVVAALPTFAAAPSIVLTHQTGPRDLARVRTAYRHLAHPGRVEAFFDDMPARMGNAHLVVARSGASTLAELAATGRPSVLVPLPTSTDDHQRKNADAMQRAGAAQVIEERDLSGARLADTVLALAGDSARRQRMSVAARALSRPDAAQLIADRITALAGLS